MRLDKTYARAEGNHMFYCDDRGEEVAVVDFVGGYGAGLFGHHHPQLTAAAIAALQTGLPINGQASVRAASAKLALELDRLLFARTGRHYVATFANSGAEAVEAALKHAEMACFRRTQRLHQTLKQQLVSLKRALKQGSCILSDDVINRAREALDLGPEVDFERLCIAVRDYNYRAFRAAPVFIGLEGAFHGKTTGAIQLTYNNDYRLPFTRLGTPALFVPASDVAALGRAVESASFRYYWLEADAAGQIILAERIHCNVGGLIVEPIQGEGGINLIDASYLAHCRGVADRYGFPLIVDEIQCGMGRTGTLLCSEQSGVSGDYILLSKSLGGGVAKISCLLVAEELHEKEFSVAHSSTFAEDDFSSRVALTVLELLSDGSVMQRCRDTGSFLKGQLQALASRFPAIIKEVRGDGLLLGLEFRRFDDSPSYILSLLSSQGLFGYVATAYLLNEHRIRVAPTMSNRFTLRLEPASIITHQHCLDLVAGLERLCLIIERRNSYHLCRFLINEAIPGDASEIADFSPFGRARTTAPVSAKRVAFMGHLVHARDLWHLEPSFTSFTESQLEALLDTVHMILRPHPFSHQLIDSTTGEQTSFSFIGLTMDSRIVARHLKNHDIEPLSEKIKEAIDIAINLGCSVVGLGGFTSIVTNNCTSITTDEIALTSGNALTVAMGIKALMKAAADTGIEPQTAHFAALGATGNICRIYCELMAEEVPRITLIGRPGQENALRALACDLYFNAIEKIRSRHSISAKSISIKSNSTKDSAHHADMHGTPHDLHGIARAIATSSVVRAVSGSRSKANDDAIFRPRLFDTFREEMGDQAPVTISTDLRSLKAANMIVAGTNSPAPLILPEHIASGPVVLCDIAVPQNTHPRVKHECPNVIHFQGGVVALPNGNDSQFIIEGAPLKRGQAFACMAETMLMGLTGIGDHGSFGPIRKAQVRHMQELARAHGFSSVELKTNSSM